MMIEHVALYTLDLERMRTFYETYFDGTTGKQYHNPETGLQTYFISFADGTRLELMTRPGLEECERRACGRAGRTWRSRRARVKTWTR